MADTQVNERPPRKYLWVIFLAILIGAVVNITIGLLTDRGEMTNALAQVRIEYFLLPFACYFANYFVDSLRLVLLLRTRNIKISFWQSLYNSIMEPFISNLTPSSAGGQLYQVHHLQRIGVRNRVSTNIIFSRFIVNSMVLMGILLISIPLLPRIAESLSSGAIIIYFGLLSTFIFSLVFLSVLIYPSFIAKLTGGFKDRWLGRMVAKFSKKPDWHSELLAWTVKLRREVYYMWRKKFGPMVVDILLNVIKIGLQGLSIWYALVAISGEAMGYFQVLIIFTVVWQVVFYIPTPGASGTLEGAFAAAFAGFTGNLALALTAVFIWRFATYYVHVFFGFVVFLLNSRIKAKPVELLRKHI